MDQSLQEAFYLVLKTEALLIRPGLLEFLYKSVLKCAKCTANGSTDKLRNDNLDKTNLSNNDRFWRPLSPSGAVRRASIYRILL